MGLPRLATVGMVCYGRILGQHTVKQLAWCEPAPFLPLLFLPSPANLRDARCLLCIIVCEQCVTFYWWCNGAMITCCLRTDPTVDAKCGTRCELRCGGQCTGPPQWDFRQCPQMDYRHALIAHFSRTFPMISQYIFTMCGAMHVTMICQEFAVAN